jgi:flavin reductase (DIM6/NTAB) family NADH-FMN oxidoreductase RutF
MNISFEEIDSKTAYKVLASLIIPRPIAWVSTFNSAGETNLAPFSFFNIMGVRPPIVAFAPGNRSNGEPKDTPRNINQNQEFVVNLVDEVLAEEMVLSAKPFDYGVSEIQEAQLATLPSIRVSAPRLARASVALECKALQTLEIGENRMIIGEVLEAHLREGLIDPSTFSLIDEKYAPIGRLASPDQYCRTTERFRLS